MQFPTWLVSKIRKPLLVISIVVAMASLLIACGDTTNQGQTSYGDTTNQDQTTPTTTVSLDDALSVIHDQRQLSYNAVLQIYNLNQGNAFQGCTGDYYLNALAYYDIYVKSNFNSWLLSLAGEVQNGAFLLNSTGNDQALISAALRANYAFTDWAGQVNDYFSTGNTCQQGQGSYLIATFPKDIPVFEPEDFSKIDIDQVKNGLQTASSVLGTIVSQSMASAATATAIAQQQQDEQAIQQQQQQDEQAITDSEWQNFCNGTFQASSC